MKLPKLPRISLRVSLVAIVGIAAVLGWYVSTIRAQRAAIAVIQEAGGSVDYDYMYEGYQFLPNGKSRVPAWLRKILGEDCFHGIVSMRVEESHFGDADLKALNPLNKLHTICVYRSKITDDGLATLRGRPVLRALWLGGNPISDEGLTNLGEELIGRLDVLELRSTRVTPAKVAELRSKYPRMNLFADGPAPGRRKT